MADTVLINAKERKMTLLERVLNMSEARVRYFSKVTPIDRILAATFLKLIPESITPNRITLFRFITIPFILYFLLADYMLLGTVLFVISAFSDALDGARARMTKHITSWGILCDPFADKLLIGSVAMIMISKYISVYLALGIVSIELLLVAFSYLRYKGHLVPAKTVGKLKMVLQCFGIGFVMLFALLGTPWLLVVATYILYVAVGFGLMSLFVYKTI
jgi:CDP-diacylglycerol--glycerol-3-phosphate 3-phosphatidyltransferase